MGVPDLWDYEKYIISIYVQTKHYSTALWCYQEVCDWLEANTWAWWQYILVDHLFSINCWMARPITPPRGKKLYAVRWWSPVSSSSSDTTRCWEGSSCYGRWQQWVSQSVRIATGNALHLIATPTQLQRCRWGSHSADRFRVEMGKMSGPHTQKAVMCKLAFSGFYSRALHEKKV